VKTTAIWDNFTNPDGESYRRLLVSKSSSNWTFKKIARHLNKKIGGEWVRKVDDKDQRSWDLATATAQITLNYEPTAGINIFPTEGEKASLASLGMMEEAYRACR